MTLEASTDKAMSGTMAGLDNPRGNIVSCPVEYPSLELTRVHDDAVTRCSFYYGQLDGLDVNLISCPVKHPWLGLKRGHGDALTRRGFDHVL
jgi:hypothetical protein